MLMKMVLVLTYTDMGGRTWRGHDSERNSHENVYLMPKFAHFETKTRFNLQKLSA